MGQFDPEINNVRVGMEDNLYISRGKLTKGNGEWVTQAKNLVTILGRTVATPGDAQQILGLNAAHSKSLFDQTWR